MHGLGPTWVQLGPHIDILRLAQAASRFVLGAFRARPTVAGGLDCYAESGQWGLRSGSRSLQGINGRAAEVF